MSRPPIDPALVGDALALVAGGVSPREAAEQLRAAGRPISRATISAAIAKSSSTPTPAPRSPPSDPSPASPSRLRAPARDAADDDHDRVGDIDAAGTPLEVARALLTKATRNLDRLAADSPRRNPAATEARNLTKLVAHLEKQAGEKETPEAVERRRREEDHDTRNAIELYIVQAEARAAAPRPGAPFGVCIHCSAPRAEPAPMEIP